MLEPVFELLYPESELLNGAWPAFPKIYKMKNIPFEDIWELHKLYKSYSVNYENGANLI